MLSICEMKKEKKEDNEDLFQIDQNVRWKRKSERFSLNYERLNEKNFSRYSSVKMFLFIDAQRHFPFCIFLDC